MSTVGQYQLIVKNMLEAYGTATIKVVVEKPLSLEEYRFETGKLQAIRDAIEILNKAADELYGSTSGPSPPSVERLYDT